MWDRCRIACWLAVPVFLARAWPSFWTTVDDAWISARFASNLAAGHGLVYSVGEPAIEGYTNLAWTVWLALGIALGIDESLWMTGSGLVLAALALPLLGELARSLLPVDAPGRRWPVVAAVWVLALDVNLAVSSTNGLETSLYLFALLGSALLAVRSGRPLLVGLVLAALAAVRPEGLLAGALLLATGRWDRRQWGLALLGLLGGWAALEGWRVATYGALLPNTFAAKADDGLFDNLPINGTYLERDVPLWIATGLGLLLGPWLRRDRHGFALAGIALGSTAAALRVYLWMPGGRLLLPVVALVLVVLASRATRVSRGLLALWLAMAAILPFTPIESIERNYDRRHSVVMPNDASRVASHLRTHLPPNSSLATRDAGVFAYFFGPENRVYELHHRALTQLHPDGADTDVRGLTPRNPDVIVVTQADPRAQKVRYGGDRKIFERAKGPYTYLGRIHQHTRRFYDVYVLAEHDVPPLPEAWVRNRRGVRAPGSQAPRGTRPTRPPPRDPPAR